MEVDMEWFEDMWNEYLAYLRDWVDGHNDVGNFGMSPKAFGEWRSIF